MGQGAFEPCGKPPAAWPAVKDSRCLVHHHGSDAFAGVHQIKPLVDLLKLQLVGDHRVDLDLAIHIPSDDFRYIRAAACAAKRRAGTR